MESLRFKSRVIFFVGVLPIFIALLIYALTWAFIFDEGFHLVAAHLIANGKRPYIDFCFPQTPLNAYINAGILILFGNHWKPVHVLAAAYLCVATWLVGDFVQKRIPDERWRTPTALAAAILFGFNLLVVQFGPASQAYAIAMLSTAAAYRAACAAVVSQRLWYALLTGVTAGFGAASTLLTAPIAIVLLAWLFFWNAAGSRIAKAAAFLLGYAIPFAPVFWLFTQGPKQTWFNVVQYQAIFRHVNWGDIGEHDIDALSDWLTSPQALLLMGLFVAAAIFLYRETRTGWTQTTKEFALAASAVFVMGLYISTARPTFGRYFIVAAPLWAILAALGLYVAGRRLASPRHAWWVCGTIIALNYAIFARDMLDEKADDHWSRYEEVAKAVTEVAPLKASLYTDELIYFLLQRDPPSGLEFSYSHKIELPPDQEKLYHVLSNDDVKKQLVSGRYTVFATCSDTAMDDLEPGTYFKQHTQPNDCDLFWELKSPNQPAK